MYGQIAGVKAFPLFGKILLSAVFVGVTTYVLFRIQVILTNIDHGHYVRAYGIAYVIPVAAITVLGGRRIGLWTLAFCVASMLYFLIPPAFSFRSDNPRDWVELGFLSTVGLVVVLGLDAMVRNASLVEAMQVSAEQQQGFLRDVLTSVTDGKLRLCRNPSELPARFTAARGAILISKNDTSTLREAAYEIAIEQGFSEERSRDLVAAVNEATLNSVLHGGGGEGRICVSPERGVVQIWIEDRGNGITIQDLPRVALERGKSTLGLAGHGFWLIYHMADRVWLFTGQHGTTVVLEQDIIAPALQGLTQLASRPLMISAA